MLASWRDRHRERPPGTVGPGAIANGLYAIQLRALAGKRSLRLAASLKLMRRA
ncbi:MAG TPA: hypothetical protein VF901_08650 [Bradyrhizobium sp.]